jgi:HEAT repeat protein
MRLWLPKPRLRLRTLIVLIALSAVMVWAGLAFLSPTRWLTRRLQADQPAFVRREAAIGLGGDRFPSREREWAIAVLIEALKDPSPRVRESAAAGLAGHEGLSKRAVPALVVLLEDHDSGVRGSSAGALGFIVGPNDRDRDVAVAALARTLDDPVVEARIMAAEALMKLGETRAVAATFTGLLRDGDRSVRQRSLSVMKRWIDPNGRALVPALVLATQDEVLQNRLAAAELLILLGRPDAAAPVLEQGRLDNDPAIRRWASQLQDKIEEDPPIR